MKHFLILSTLSFFIFLIPNVTLSEIYKYIDKNGQMRFTDDLSKIPSNQRLEVEEINEYKRPSSDDRLVNKRETEVNIAEPEQSNDAGDSKDMREEYETLQKERVRLEKMRANVKTQEEVDQYNQKVDVLANRIKQYNIRLKADIERKMKQAE